ncbi:MAG: DUF6263 family protein [Planctomycetota bacterium]
MSTLLRFLACCFVALIVSDLWADENKAGDAAEGHLLRYRFDAGQTLRWSVTHRSLVRSTVSGTTQNAETFSTSVKVWRVAEVKPDGTARFEQMVEDIDMRHQLTGREEVRYNSRTDRKPPPGFDDVASTIGVPLAELVIDARGKVLERKQKAKKAQASSTGEITIILPEKPVAVGDSWTEPHDLCATTGTGAFVRIKAQQRFTLENVKTGVATIALATQILTPIHDPAIEAQVAQHAIDGVVRFDIDAGRILSQQVEVDRRVVGFRGHASSLHYATRFTEEFRSAKETEVASRAVESAGTLR